MLCGETLCGDKFLFSFPPDRMLTKCQCTLTIVYENRLFALTLVSICSGGKENNSRLSMLIGCRYRRAAIHHAWTEKSCMPISTANQHRDPEILFVTRISISGNVDL